jgi:hypothetical protein
MVEIGTPYIYWWLTGAVVVACVIYSLFVDR